MTRRTHTESPETADERMVRSVWFQGWMAASQDAKRSRNWGANQTDYNAGYDAYIESIRRNAS